ncbi:D-inositol 3-phosphate glycosyltransferase [Thiorhodovibrio winogradskyi]|uniref:D-inositol 3-phosphate glycosyltransferase n=1 Tax=Thiorhodovibrio winogradskyi TaxID=77007 RepID=A0ABZ0SCA3_9GAMM|nr:glycosyltransferase family 4 protein [Thiorhodovibrio winogradskyi]
MKVAYFALAPYIAGSERSLQVLLEHATAAGVTPVVISPSDSPLLSWAKNKGIKCCAVDINYISPKSSPLKWVLAQICLIKHLLTERVELIHSNQMWSLPSTRFVSKLLKIPVVCHLRDPIEKKNTWWLTPAPDATICVSKHIERQLLASLGNKITNNITIIDPVEIPQGIASNTSLAKLRFEAKQHFRLPLDSVILGFIGQISDVKGVCELIETFSLLKNNNTFLLIAGKDSSPSQEYLEKCRSLISRHGLAERVTFLGFLEETKQFYHAVDLVVMYSKEEPLGLIPLEAAARYTPTLAANVGGLPELIEHGHTGWLEDELECSKRAINLGRIITADLSQFGQNARLFLERMPGPKEYAEQIVRIYHRLLSG